MKTKRFPSDVTLSLKRILRLPTEVCSSWFNLEPSRPNTVLILLVFTCLFTPNYSLLSINRWPFLYYLMVIRSSSLRCLLYRICEPCFDLYKGGREGEVWHGEGVTFAVVPSVGLQSLWGPPEPSLINRTLSIIEFCHKW